MLLSFEALGKHIYMIGTTGAGKSRGIEALAVQLMKAGVGVGVFDPHGELYHNLLARIARKGCRIWDNVVLIDPLNPEHTVGFNPLELQPGEVAERRAQFLADVVSKIFRADPLITARMQRMMFHAFWLLIAARLTLVEFPPLLTDRDFRTRLLEQSNANPKLRQYWEREFPTNQRTVTEWTQSSLNKVGELVTDPDIELMLGQVKSSIDFRSIMDQGKVFLAHLPKGRLSGRGSYLMGAFLLAQVQLAALSRADSPYAKPRQFVLFIDEFQNYLTEDIHEILAESRKYGLSLIMAHQHLGQLDDAPLLKAAVLNTVGNIVCFQMGSQDATQVVQDIFTPAVDMVKDYRSKKVPTGIDWWPYTTEFEPVYRPLGEIWELARRELTQLAPREMWYKRRGPYPPQKLRTPDMPDIQRSPKLERALAELEASSFTNYGRPKAAVRKQISERQTILFGEETTNGPVSQPERNERNQMRSFNLNVPPAYGLMDAE